MASSSSSSLKMTAMALAFFFLLFFASVGSSSAAVYTVGGSKGWTVLSPVPDYSALAAMETFHVGDTLLFVYNKQYHNVVEVNKPDYDACTTASAIATYATGNDSLTIKTAGAHYFLCGVPNHCGLGQKVEILATPANGSASPVPVPVPVPAPAPNAAVVAHKGPVGLGLMVVFSLILTFSLEF